MALVWIVLYIALAVTIGIRSLYRGHLWMFVLGFPFPPCWLIGAVMEPTADASRYWGQGEE